MDYHKAFTTREIAVFDEINGISAKYKALGLPFYDRQDYADITKASDRLAITDVGITADNQLHPNYTEQIFYCDPRGSGLSKRLLQRPVADGRICLYSYQLSPSAAAY